MFLWKKKGLFEELGTAAITETHRSKSFSDNNPPQKTFLFFSYV